MKHTIRLSIFAGLAMLIAFFNACECEDLSPFIPENTPNTFSVTRTVGSIDQPNIYFSLNFNQPIDTFSFRIGKSVFVEGMSPVSIFYSGSYIVLSGPGNQCNNDRCRVKITLKGNGSEPVKSLSGQILDGDADGSKGGDFVIEQDVE